MTTDDLVQKLITELEKRANAGNPVEFWLRDDDAVSPSEPLDRLIALTGSHAIPLTLAVIPALTGRDLAERLASCDQISVAVHGWSHTNHAPSGEKKQELGLHRSMDEILAELSQARSLLSSLYGPRFVPLLVPPWNRISPVIAEQLPDIAYKCLSTFGVAQPANIAVVNTHIDLIDWKGSRGGRDHDVLFAEVVQQLQVTAGPIGLLTHHLVHDDKAWRFLEDFFALTAHRQDCTWVSIEEYIPAT